MNFLYSYNTLFHKTLNHINNYKGEKALTLATGERAIDMDDAWLLIGQKDTPILRDKREQRLREKGNCSHNNDVALAKNFPLDDICKIADSLS